MMNYGGYNYYNPYNPYNQITQQLANNQNQQNVHLKVMLVSNEEEAKATPADLNGNPTFFYNKSANKIYLKQINPQTGAAPLQVFNAEPQPDSNIKTQPDEMMRYQTLLNGINGLYKLLAPRQDITTQPSIMTEPEEYSEPKKGGKNAK